MKLESLQLDPNEHILKTVHRHWIMLLQRIFSLVVFVVMPPLAWIIVLILQAVQIDLPVDFAHYTSHFIYLYLTWLLFLWMSLAHMLVNHYLDVWIITSQRIITIDQQGFFRRHIGSFRLEKLQDINIEINGIIATFLDYGTVEVETASESMGEFRAHHLPHPQALKALILEATDSLNRNQRAELQSL